MSSRVTTSEGKCPAPPRKEGICFFFVGFVCWFVCLFVFLEGGGISQPDTHFQGTIVSCHHAKYNITEPPLDCF